MIQKPSFHWPKKSVLRGEFRGGRWGTTSRETGPHPLGTSPPPPPPLRPNPRYATGALLDCKFMCSHYTQGVGALDFIGYKHLCPGGEEGGGARRGAGGGGGDKKWRVWIEATAEHAEDKIQKKTGQDILPSRLPKFYSITCETFGSCDMILEEGGGGSRYAIW